MKRVWLAGIVALLASCAWAQTTTTITGTIKDLAQVLVTSGQVTFTLMPSRDTTISGIARFSPQTITCSINASGLIKAQNGSSPCTLTMNTALQPTGTYYSVAVWPGFVKTSTFTFYAVLSTYDWSTVVPTPTTSPAQNFVDIFSNQTIGGAKVWQGTQSYSALNTFGAGLTSSGPNTLAGTTSLTGPTTLTGQNSATLYSINGDLYLDGQKYPTLAAALAALPSGGTLRITAGTFTLSAQVAMVSNLDIECSPNNQTILQASASLNAAMFVASSINHFRIAGCVIDGNKGNNSNQFPLFQATSASYGELRGNHFQNGQSRAVWIAGGNSYIRVTGNEVDHYGQAIPASVGNEGIVVAPPGSGASNSHIVVDHNRVHDGNLGITVYPSAGASNPTVDIQIASNSVWAIANDGILLGGRPVASSSMQGIRIQDNDIWCGGWPANGTGFSANCTAGYLQTGSTASSSGAGVDITNPYTDQPQVINNRAHDMFFEGIDITPFTATTVSCVNTPTVTYVSGDPFLTVWKALQGVRINGLFYNIAAVAGATSTLTLATNCPTGTWGFTGAGYSRATMNGNVAWNNGRGNGSTSGSGFSDGGYGDTYVNNVSYGNNFVGYIDQLSSYVTHTGDKAFDNDVGGGSTNAFLCQQCLYPSWVNITADDSTGAHQTIGVSISGGTNGAWVSSANIGATLGAAIADSGAGTNFLINGVLSRSGVTDTVGAGAAAGNCTVGSTYHNSTAASASTALYICQPANTWTAVTVP